MFSTPTEHFKRHGRPLDQEVLNDRSLRLVADNSSRKASFEDIAIVGLGYVGLPLAARLATRFQNVVGLDISNRRVSEITRGVDAAHEVDELTLRTCGLQASTNQQIIDRASFYVVAVPTPIDTAHQPDLGPLKAACESVGQHISKGDVVVFESTVYPGATEEICAPILEQMSGLKAGVDFGLGYSPERINPGDKTNTLKTVVKVVSGDSTETLERVKAVYETVVEAGLHAAPSIRVAEASKVLENTQRDVNIALMNEMALICDKIGIKTHDVIEASSTKWNFVQMTPGLVGGHCIGVDPYYLAALAEKIGHSAQLITAGRQTNESMVRHTADAALRLLIKQGGEITNKRVGICGIAFKEDVPDMRNSKILEVVEILRSYGIEPLIHDPHCSPDDARAHGISLCGLDEVDELDMMILATAHSEYQQDKTFLKRIRQGGILMDIKGAYRKANNAQDLMYWSF